MINQTETHANLTPTENPSPHLVEAVWTGEPIWTVWKRGKYFARFGIQIQTLLASRLLLPGATARGGPWPP